MRDPISEALVASTSSPKKLLRIPAPCWPVGFTTIWSRGGSWIPILTAPFLFFFFSIWPIPPERNSQASAYRLKSTSHVLETLWRPAVEGRFGSLTFENVEFHTFFFSCVWCLQACGLHGPKRISSPSTRVGNGMRLAPKGMGILNSL